MEFKRHHRGIDAIGAMAYKLEVRTIGRQNINWNYSLWTPELDHIIKTYYPIGGSQLCKQKIEELGCSKSAATCKQRAIKLGVKRPGLSDKWTEEEISILKEVYPVKYQEEVIAALPNRNWETIRKKAQSLKLSRKNALKHEQANQRTGPAWTEEENKFLIAHYPTEGAAIYVHFKDRTEGAVRSHARELGLRRLRLKADKTIHCIELDITCTLKEAIDDYGLSEASLYEALRNSCTAAGYHWEYVEENE